MKAIKSLLLGTAALFAGAAAVQAADLAAPEPVEYVRICDAYGAGYFFIPGTDTCLKISGVVRAYYGYATNNLLGGAESFREIGGGTIAPVFANLQVANAAGVVQNVNVGTVSFANNGIVPAANPVFANNTVIYGKSPVNDQFNLGVRARLEFDARSRTEWGVLRSFFQFAARSNNFARNGDTLQVRYGFVQFGVPGNGLVTAGISDSFFNGVNLDGTYIGDTPGDRGDRVPVLAYTASFGNGISATISLEDSGNTYTNGNGQANSGGTTYTVLSGGTGTGTISNSTGQVAGGETWQRRSVQVPDLVGNLTVAQAWGTAWVSGAIAQARLINSNCARSVTLICTSDQTGWAVSGGVKILLPALAKGDQIVVKGTYADGAIEYIGNLTNAGTSLGSGTLSSFWGNGNVNPITGLQCGVGAAACDGGITSITGWSIAASFVHYLTPAVTLQAAIGYARLDPSFTGGLGANVVFLREQYGVSGLVTWTPVKNLELGVEVFYNNTKYDAFVGQLGQGAAARAFRASDSAWGGLFRIQRAF